jgi:hypothetical protein
MEQTEERTGVSRRKVVVGVAWSVPAIIAASALPAYAASTTVTQVSVTAVGTSSGNTNLITVTFHTTDGTPVTVGTQAEITVNVTTVASSSPTYGISTTVGNGTIVSKTPSTRTTTGTIIVVLQLSTVNGTATTTASFTVIEWKNGTVGTAQATGGTPSANNGSVSPTGGAVSIPS